MNNPTLTSTHLINKARETAYAAMTDINEVGYAAGFVPCDDGGEIFIKVEIINLTPITTVGPIFYSNEVHPEIYVIEDEREAVETLAQALSFRRYDFPF